MNNIDKTIEIIKGIRKAIINGDPVDFELCDFAHGFLIKAKQDREDALNFAKELDAWLSFNNNPTSEQLSTMRKDLNKLIKQLSE